MTSIGDLDPGSGTFLTPGSGIQDGEKIRIRDEYHGILDHFSESLETVFGLKIVKFFDADPDLLNPGSGIRYKHPGPATLLMNQ